MSTLWISPVNQKSMYTYSICLNISPLKFMGNQKIQFWVFFRLSMETSAKGEMGSHNPKTTMRERDIHTPYGSIWILLKHTTRRLWCIHVTRYNFLLLTWFHMITNSDSSFVFVLIFPGLMSNGLKSHDLLGKTTSEHLDDVNNLDDESWSTAVQKINRLDFS